MLKFVLKMCCKRIMDIFNVLICELFFYIFTKLQKEGKFL